MKKTQKIITLPLIISLVLILGTVWFFTNSAQTPQIPLEYFQKHPNESVVAAWKNLQNTSKTGFQLSTDLHTKFGHYTADGTIQTTATIANLPEPQTPSIQGTLNLEEKFQLDPQFMDDPTAQSLNTNFVLKVSGTYDLNEKNPTLDFNFTGTMATDETTDGDRFVIRLTYKNEKLTCDDNGNPPKNKTIRLLYDACNTTQLSALRLSAAWGNTFRQFLNFTKDPYVIERLGKGSIQLTEATKDDNNAVHLAYTGNSINNFHPTDFWIERKNGTFTQINFKTSDGEISAATLQFSNMTLNNQNVNPAATLQPSTCEKDHLYDEKSACTCPSDTQKIAFADTALEKSPFQCVTQEKALQYKMADLCLQAKNSPSDKVKTAISVLEAQAKSSGIFVKKCQ